MRRALTGSLLIGALVALGGGCSGGGIKDPPSTLKIEKVQPKQKKSRASIGEEPPEKIPPMPGFTPGQPSK